MKKFIKILGLLSMSLSTSQLMASSQIDLSSTLNEKNLSSDINNNLEINKKLSDINLNINLATSTMAVGKSWGTGSTHKDGDDATYDLDVRRVGYKNVYALQSDFSSISLMIAGQYYFVKSKSFLWDDYYNKKTTYTADRTLNWFGKENFGEEISLTNVTGTAGGFGWGNYYKSWLQTRIKNLYTIEIKIRYEIAAYGAGSNKYWSAGTIWVNQIRFNAR